MNKMRCTVLMRENKILTPCRQKVTATLTTLAALDALLNGRSVMTKNVQVVVS